MRKMDDCVDSPFNPATGADGRKFAENPRDSKSDAPRMHAYALRKGDRSRIIISSRRSAVFLVIHISFHERIFVRLDCDD